MSARRDVFAWRGRPLSFHAMRMSAYWREHLRALAQRIEVAEKEVRIMGSKSDLLRTLSAVAGAKPAHPAFGLLF